MTVTPLVRTELDADGKLVRAWLPSSTYTGVMYEMARDAQGRWCHLKGEHQLACPASGHCYHIAAMEEYDRCQSED